MPDEDRFDGIGSALEGEEDTGEGEESSGGGDAASVDAGAGDDEEGGPAFTFDEATQRSVYPLPETWDRLQAELSRAEADLRADHGISDPEGRELQDAALRVATDHVDEIVDEVVKGREESENE